MNVSDYILNMRGNMCKSAIRKIKEGLSIDQLLALYIENIDFCLSENFPSKEDLKSKGGSRLADFGIFIDDRVDAINPNDIVMLGNCSGNVLVKDGFVSKIYIKDTSVLSLNTKEDSLVIVDLFDESILTASALERSKVIINLYGKAQVKGDINHRIKINHKHKDNY